MRAAAAALFWSLAAWAVAQEQHAQPPPEFTSGYSSPHALAPLPRAEVWQWLDVAVLIVVLFFGARAVLTQRSRNTVRLLSYFSVGYFGFYKLGCVCAIGSIQNVAYAATHPDYSVPWVVAAFFLIPLVTALFLGRIFCGTACPMGALQDILLVRPTQIPAWLSGPLETIPYLYLGASVAYALMGSGFLICQLDPFVSIFRFSGPTTVVVFGAVILALSLFVGRPYCRFLCPYGVLLRWASALAKKQVTISPAGCVNCHLCAGACPYGAIEPPTVSQPTSRKAAALNLLLLPALMLLFAAAGYLAAPALSLRDARVGRAVELLASKPDPNNLKAEAWRRQGQDESIAITEARRVQSSFTIGITALGAWFGLVFGVRAILAARRRKREIYAADPSACLSCARCYASCPVEVENRYPGLANLAGGSR